MHLAGKPLEERERLLRKHAGSILARMETPAEAVDKKTRSIRDEEKMPEERGISIAVDVEVVTFKSKSGSAIVLRPISLSAPEDLWQPVVSYKTSGFAPSIPGNSSTYAFEDEDAYHESYRYVSTCMSVASPTLPSDSTLSSAGTQSSG